MKIYSQNHFNILYVEDDDSIRSLFGKYLKRKFNQVTFCNNGADAYLKFQEARLLNNPYDLIISDINMPKMNGIEMLEKIRSICSSTAFIITTGKSEITQTIKALNLNTSAYILKPINFIQTELALEEIIQNIYKKKNENLKKMKSEEYLKLIDNEALISKTDNKGIITFVNNTFCKKTGYYQDDLIGKSHNILKHPTVTREFFKNLWETISIGNIWEGVIKIQAKNNDTIYLNTKIIPVFDNKKENIIEYISIRFLVTNLENKKRNITKKLIEQVSDNKKLKFSYNKEKEQLLKKIEILDCSLKNVEDLHKNNSLKKESLVDQIKSYESNNIETNKIDVFKENDKNKQFEKIKNNLFITKNKNKQLKKDLEDIKQNLDLQKSTLNSYEKRDIYSQKHIENLKDIVTNLQEENILLKKNKKNKKFKFF